MGASRRPRITVLGAVWNLTTMPESMALVCWLNATEGQRSTNRAITRRIATLRVVWLAV